MYPTMDEVEAAGREQICRWHRFLKSPGMSAIGTDHFDETCDREALVMTRIQERLTELGGFTPEISKRIGWR